jgi:hypothetical protein
MTGQILSSGMCRIEPVTYKIYEKKMWEKREGAHESVRN